MMSPLWSLPVATSLPSMSNFIVVPSYVPATWCHSPSWPLMAPAVKNDRANCTKLRTAWEELGEPAAVFELLKKEAAARQANGRSLGMTPLARQPKTAKEGQAGEEEKEGLLR